MKVLVICEESQAVCKAFRERGHEAYSCDIKPCSGGYPEWHIQEDGLKIMKSAAWDLLIAHPPCTYFSRMTSCNFTRKVNFDKQKWFENFQKAKNFFMEIYNSDIKKICIENVVPRKQAGLPPYTQIIQPFDFGENFSKQTCLWLKGLPPLMPNCIVTNRKKGTDECRPWLNVAFGSTLRSKTFNGIAQAMAQQWGGNIL